MENNMEKEFIDFYEEEADSIFRFFALRISDRETALELVQETFLKYWQAMQKGKVENDRAYVFSIARNLVIDWYRKKKSISLDEKLESEEGQKFDIKDDLVQNPENFADAKMALEKVSSLPPQYREIIYLRFVEGLSPQEIAQVLREAPNATSVRLSRALEALRKILKIND